MAHALDNGKRRFRALVNSATEAKPQLPLVHTTDSYVFEDALADGEIRPQPCDTFTGEALTYFFYGRPSFRPNATANPTSLVHYFPVCLLFDPDRITSLKRVFPFDSGAFQSGLYGAYLHKKMKLGDFGLEPDMATPGRLVSLFFGSPQSYLTGRGLDARFDPAQFEAASYSALVNAKDGNAIDSRGSGIEIQTEDALRINGSVIAAIIPSTFADGLTGRQIKSLGIEVIGYRTYERTRPGEYTSQLSDLCLNYYVRRKLIKESDL
jgi:hypothetical protein